jgi:hypothetical protein
MKIPKELGGDGLLSVRGVADVVQGLQEGGDGGKEL